MTNALALHAKKIINREDSPLRLYAEKICEMMYGTPKRTRITISLSVAALFFALYLQHLAATGVCQTVGLK